MLPRAPVSSAAPVHSRLSSRSPCAAAASSRREPSFAGSRGPSAGLGAQFDDPLLDLFGARPGFVFGRRQDRPQRQAEPHLAPVLCRRRAHPRGEFAHLLVRLAPQRIDIGMLAGDRDRRIRRAAEIDRNARLLHAAHRGRGAGEAVVFPGMIHRAGLGPDALEDVHVFVGARVALVLRQRVAVAQLVHIVAAGDHVDRRASAGDLIQRGELARRQRRRDEAGPVREQEAQPLGVRRRRGGQQEPVGPVGEIAHQHAVEARRLRRLGEVADVAAIEDQRPRRMDLRGMPVMDHADEFDGHGDYPCGHAASIPIDRPVTRPGTLR